MSIAKWPTKSSADTLSHKIDCSNQEAKRDYYILYHKKQCVRCKYCERICIKEAIALPENHTNKEALKQSL
jgi:formate hydrogenlyase subunit 6/NADH:ubiquinone oxidoreductase subunit I